MFRLLEQARKKSNNGKAVKSTCKKESLCYYLVIL